MIEVKTFTNGGLNQDVDESLMKPNEWDYALNVRNTDRLEFSDGVLSNLKGNTIVGYSKVFNSVLSYFNGLPSGTNKCIGSYANESTGKFYSFIYNSLGSHLITEYDNFSGNISIILEGDYLNFQPFQYINGVGIVGGNLLYWTDGYNPPRSIDIKKAKGNEFYTDSNSISLIKAPPINIIYCLYKDDSNKQVTQNRLKRQLFQFKYRYIYHDDSISAWSANSSVPLPILEDYSNLDTYKNNHIDISFNIGNKFVKSIEIAAQVKGVALNNTQDWFSILTINRDEITKGRKIFYNKSLNTATYSFYNDGLYQSVDVKEIDISYDFVPLVSKTLEIVNGNVLVLGNNTEGYDNIETDISLKTTYESILTNRFGVIFNTYYLSNPLFFASPTSGDVINYSWNGVAFPSGSGSYTVTGTLDGDLFNTVLAVQNAITASTSGNIVFVKPPKIYPPDVLLPLGAIEIFPESPTSFIYASLSELTVTLNTVITDSVPAWKTNSMYQMGLVYYDDFNRSTYVQTSTDYIFKTKSYGDTAGNSPLITTEIKHFAPSWAKKYQWVRTENLTHKTFLFWVASSVGLNPLNPNQFDLNISSLNTYNTNNKDSILLYDFSVGDRCTVHKDSTGFITGYDVSVIGYDTETGILTIEKKGGLIAGSSGILIEIYTPKTRATDTKEQFFYEFGEVYDVIDGKYHYGTTQTQTDSQSAISEFKSGDVYKRTRQIPGLSSVKVEDPNFSDFYKSNYSSNGRVNIFAPQAKQLSLPTDIRYSDTYVPNTNINGLNRFYGDAFQTYDRINGSIQKLAVRDNYLLTFQELKTGYIPIEQSIIEDQGSGGDANVAISSKLLNKIRYFAGDYGIGLNPESFARFAGTVYFADPNRGYILKLSGGLQPISTIGMDSYFTKKLSEVRNISNVKLIGSYDPRNDEYIITIKRNDSISETIAFNEQINRWTSFYSFTPEHANYIFNKYMTFLDGSMYEHNTNNTYNYFYNTLYPSKIDITFNGNPISIKTFIGIMEQSSDLWLAPEILTSTTSQKSSLNGDDFLQKEGVWFASLLRDENSPGGLFEGDDLKGNWIKFKLRNDSNFKINTLSISSNHIPSYQGIK